MTAGDTGAVEGLNHSDGPERKVSLAAEVHHPCLQTRFCRFARHLGRRYKQGIIPHTDAVAVSIVIIVSVTDKDVLARNIFRLGNIPRVSRKKRVHKKRGFFLF